MHSLRLGGRLSRARGRPRSAAPGPGPTAPPPAAPGAGAEAEVGRLVADRLATPLDFVAAGPRTVLGALRQAERLAELAQRSPDRVAMLLQDPRPPAEKPAVVAGELEALWADLLDTGKDSEAQLLSQVAQLLPPEVVDGLPEELRAEVAQYAAQDAGAAEAAPEDGGEDEEEPYEPETAESVASAGFQQAQQDGELADVARCLGQVQEALAAIQAATPDGRGMAVVNLREARDVLRTRLGEVRLEPGALAEANALLEEVDAYLA